MATILDMQVARGALSATPDTEIATVADGYSVRIFGTFANKGSSVRLVTIEFEGTRIFTGEATNSPLNPGQTLEIDIRARLEDGEGVQAWQDSGTDVEFYLTIAVVPEP
jgi:hypothetical protein